MGVGESNKIEGPKKHEYEIENCRTVSLAREGWGSLGGDFTGLRRRWIVDCFVLK